MMAWLHDSWPVLVAVVGALGCLWGAEWLGFNRGYFAGRADVHREQRHAQKGGRL